MNVKVRIGGGTNGEQEREPYTSVNEKSYLLLWLLNFKNINCTINITWTNHVGLPTSSTIDRGPEIEVALPVLNHELNQRFYIPFQSSPQRYGLCICLLLLSICLFLFRKRGREMGEEQERETEIEIREEHQSVASCMHPNLSTSPGRKSNLEAFCVQNCTPSSGMPGRDCTFSKMWCI